MFLTHNYRINLVVVTLTYSILITGLPASTGLSQKQEGDICYLRNNERGLCTNYYDCKVTDKPQYQHELCNQKDDSLVCCKQQRRRRTQSESKFENEFNPDNRHEIETIYDAKSIHEDPQYSTEYGRKKHSIPTHTSNGQILDDDYSKENIYDEIQKSRKISETVRWNLKPSDPNIKATSHEREDKKYLTSQSHEYNNPSYEPNNKPPYNNYNPKPTYQPEYHSSPAYHPFRPKPPYEDKQSPKPTQQNNQGQSNLQERPRPPEYEENPTYNNYRPQKPPPNPTHHQQSTKRPTEQPQFQNSQQNYDQDYRPKPSQGRPTNSRPQYIPEYSSQRPNNNPQRPNKPPSSHPEFIYEQEHTRPQESHYRPKPDYELYNPKPTKQPEYRPKPPYDQGTTPKPTRRPVSSYQPTFVGSPENVYEHNQRPKPSRQTTQKPNQEHSYEGSSEHGRPPHEQSYKPSNSPYPSAGPSYNPDPSSAQRPRPRPEPAPPIIAGGDYFNQYTSTTRRTHTTRGTTKRPQRISEIKCTEYAEMVTETIAGLPLTTDPNPVEINIQKCNYNAQQLIVGGENTTVGEFPHMAAVGFLDKKKRGVAWNCGGSLISEYYVLTAAHCTTSSYGHPSVVRLGEFNLKRGDDGAHPVDYLVKDVIKHPDYKPPIRYNDIALLRLSRAVTFTKYIRPACIYSKNTFSTTKTVATGWGRIEYAEDQSDTLLKVVLSIIDNAKCNKLYKTEGTTEVLAQGIVGSQMCAGELAGGKDTCQGDSGGPIEITSRSNQCVHHIIGVTSFGKHCAKPNAPGVYTRVSSYVPWIESIVWRHHQ